MFKNKMINNRINRETEVSFDSIIVSNLPLPLLPYYPLLGNGGGNFCFKIN